jgi:hypothetical protein
VEAVSACKNLKSNGQITLQDAKSVHATRVTHKAASGKLLDLVAAREDAELQQKVSLELRDIPNTIPAFK